MRSKALTWLLFLSGLLLASPADGNATAAVSGLTTSRGGLTFHSAFRRAGTTAGITTNGRYVFAAALEQSSDDLGVLFDDETNTRRIVRAPAGCDSPTGSIMLGGPWLLLYCANAQTAVVELYDLAHGTWTSRPPNPEITQYCSLAGMVSCAPIAVGADWIEFNESCYHCGDRDQFQSIETGQVRGDPRDSHTVVDLDAPALAQPVCRPLSVPSAGSLVFDGRFAVATGAASYLEQCGSRLRRRIGWLSADPTNRSAMIWLAGSTRPGQPLRFGGVFLPAMRPFVLAAPASVGAVSQFLLGARNLYVHAGANDQLWIAHVLG